MRISTAVMLPTGNERFQLGESAPKALLLGTDAMVLSCDVSPSDYVADPVPAPIPDPVPATTRNNQNEEGKRLQMYLSSRRVGDQ